MHALLNTLVLPSAISDFEHRYLRRINRIAFVFFALHLPVFVLVAYFHDMSVLLAAGLTLATLAGPLLANYAFQSPRAVSMSVGFTAMLMGGLLVHFGQGPVQIEMHFYFFAVLAMLAVYGNPMVILVAALTVVAHHLVLWVYLPSSVFNYAAPLWVVAVHAGFVFLESIGSIFIARSFFRNVIGLQRIVDARTRELDARNGDLRLVLDNVGEGFVTLGMDGRMSRERSAVVDRWFDVAPTTTLFADYLRTASADVAEAFECGWEQLIEGVLPLELSLDQLPKHVEVSGRYISLEYLPIGKAEPPEKVLIVMSDITSEVLRTRVEAEQREALHVFERVLTDREGFLEFFEEAKRLVAFISGDSGADPVLLKRVVHTLKGNAAIFQIQTLADICHAIETRLTEANGSPTATQVAELLRRWNGLQGNLAALLGGTLEHRVEVDDAAYEALVHAVTHDTPRDRLVEMVLSLRLEPTARRLRRIADHTQRIASRLNKGDLAIHVRHDDLRLDARRFAPFWAAFAHVVRNAVDHGIEDADERRSRGKAPRGRIDLATHVDDQELLIEICDDGRGIDWDAIAASAKARGLPVESEGDLVEALCSDGITTKESADDLSGRGIGMGAVRAACRDLQGSLAIQSEKDRGTRIVFHFPSSQMAAAPAHLQGAF